MAKVGDTVRFLNTTGGGRIVRIDGAVAYVDDDGFEVPMLIKECVVVAQAGSDAMAKSRPAPSAAKPKQATAPKVAPAPPQVPHFEPEEAAVLPEVAPYVETAEGEKLNVQVAFMPHTPKQLTRGAFDAYLVNDSNYCLYSTLLVREASTGMWRTLYAAMSEPDTVDFACRVDSTDLADIDRLALQYIPFKVGKPFALKAMACVEHRIDASKFFKVHCYAKNIYFDEPVLAFNIVHNDVPERVVAIDAPALEKAMMQKAQADSRPARPKQQPRQTPAGPMVVDLHISELVDTTAGLSNADMLNLQIDTFRKVMDENLRNTGKKIVFIHGKGEGVLRKAVLKELAYRYKNCDVQDASFREYGFGATQVTIK